MKGGLKLILIIAAIAILLSIAILGLKQGAINETASGKTSFVTNILVGLDFTGGKTVADSITKSSEIRMNINPFGDSP